MKSYHDVGLKFDCDHPGLILDARIKHGQETSFQDVHLGEEINAGEDLLFNPEIPV